jgi:hypothetical protein
MINVQEMFWSLAEYGKDYVSGEDPIGEFNNKLAESQKMAFDMLAPEYDKNERIRVMLDPFVKMVTTTSNASGVIPKPIAFYRAIGGNFTIGGRNYPLYYAKTNEIINSDFIPQRKADISKGVAYITYVNDSITLSPKVAQAIDLYYLSVPQEAKLVYTYSVSRAAYVTVNAVDTVNLEWGEDAYNLILSILLLKYSLITRDEFKLQIGTYGINNDLMHKP